jgi:hypothetical protein
MTELEDLSAGSPAQQQRTPDPVRVRVSPGISSEAFQLEVPRELLDTPFQDVLRAAIQRPENAGEPVSEHLASLIARAGQEVRLEHGGQYHGPQASAREVLRLSDEASAQDQKGLVRVMKRQRGGGRLHWG